MDEVAGRLGTSRNVRLEISVDAVLHLTAKGLLQKLPEVVQAMGVIGQTKLAAEQKKKIINKSITPIFLFFFLLKWILKYIFNIL